jgi:anti-anti-sigma factor
MSDAASDGRFGLGDLDTGADEGALVIQVDLDGCELSLLGRLDVHSVADVRAALHAAIDAGTGDLILDLRGVEVADATGLGVLIGAHRRADRMDRRLVLREVPPRLTRLLAATRLHRILRVEAPAATV